MDVQGPFECLPVPIITGVLIAVLVIIVVVVAACCRNKRWYQKHMKPLTIFSRYLHPPRVSGDVSLLVFVCV